MAPGVTYASLPANGSFDTTADTEKPQFVATATPVDAIESIKLGLQIQRHEQNGTTAKSLDVTNSAWTHSRESSNNFISDFYTKPTLPMLEAIVRTTLGDGDNDEDAATNALQEYVADLMGHESALLVPTGTMGNQVSLRTALGNPPHSILVDYRGHIIHFEGGGPSAICGTLIRTVVPANGHHLTLSDVQKFSTVRNTMYDCPTRVIALENPMEGRILPLADIQAISTWARAQNPPIHMHLDGARLWEAVAAGACTLREIGACFDSIQMCFTKGLGAPLGSIVVGSSVFIQRAKWSRKMLGGGTRSSGVIAGPARLAIDDVLFGGKMKRAQEKARRASELWVELGGKLLERTETNMVWVDLEGSGIDAKWFYPMAKNDFGLNIGGVIPQRIVFHYQISDEAFARLCDFFRKALGTEAQDTNSY
ncbi:l-allo-threonine aldolase [Cucurbitaria berberidis CBS 394.84]|uniref:L-allo-threonine aldolase n=1 Tax=Cucurbitaria berberidis CBS 394.84 TaxID=1168544 RepID=A0A9P4LA78_9PLEO|nr:l-allo-threonine aldolase [Cucurbitaria berberidis CBS 394.84]KAF1846934.1 l-allo-threonine aldolase [Cucurbitaria berberidis CBS 394.84]